VQLINAMVLKAKLTTQGNSLNKKQTQEGREQIKTA